MQFDPVHSSIQQHCTISSISTRFTQHLKAIIEISTVYDRFRRLITRITPTADTGMKIFKNSQFSRIE